MVRGNQVSTATGTLARMGFEDAEAAAAILGKVGDAADSLVHLLAVTADPTRRPATSRSSPRADDGTELLEDLIDDEGFAMRLLLVLGATRPSATTCCTTPSSGGS